MSQTPERPQGDIGYTFTTQATIDGRAGELQIRAETFSDLRMAVRLIGKVAPADELPPAGGATWQGGDARGVNIPEEEIPECPVHHSKMRPSKTRGFFCSAKDRATGEFCKVQIK